MGSGIAGFGTDDCGQVVLSYDEENLCWQDSGRRRE